MCWINCKDAIPKFSLFPNLFSIFFMFLFMIGQMVGHDVKKIQQRKLYL